jgi:cytochrome c1
VKLPFLLLVAIAAGSWALPATARQHASSCANHDEIVKILTERYREAPRAIGLANKSAVVEVFTSKAGTWTILLTKTDGASCILGAGSNWEESPPAHSMTAL